MVEHPDITSALEMGYPARAFEENRDTAEARREFAEEFIGDFIDFAVDGDPEILENFIHHMKWKTKRPCVYKDWLN